MGFPRQEYWSELLFPSPEDLPNPGIEPVSLVYPALQVDSLPTVPSGKSSRTARLKKKKSATLNASENVEGLELSFIAGGKAKWCRYSGKQF